jgi:hypothetical protein
MTITVPCLRITLQLSQRAFTEALTFKGSSMSRCFSSALLESIRDSASGEVVGRKLHSDPVARQDADEVHSQLARYVRQDAVAVLELDSEHRVGQWLQHSSFDLNRILLSHVLCVVPFSHECRPSRPTHERIEYQRTPSPATCQTRHQRDPPTVRLKMGHGCVHVVHAVVRMTGPSSVTAIVCSKWAASE